MNAPADRPMDPLTGEFIERRVRTGTIADRRDAGTMARKKWARALNIAFVISASLALVLPAVASSYFGITVHKVVSNSMYPAMYSGDMFFAKITTAQMVQEGDVILLMNPKSWVIQSHRVIEKSFKGDTVELITKGDANVEADDPYVVGLNTAIRKEVLTVPKFGYVINAISSPQGKLTGLVLIIVINVLIVGNVLVKRRKTDPKEPFFPKKSVADHEPDDQLKNFEESNKEQHV